MTRASDAGYRAIQPGVNVPPDRRRLPLAPIIDPRPELDTSKDEIFGPILPVIFCDSINEVVDVVAAGERPLALCVYTPDDAVADHVLTNTEAAERASTRLCCTVLSRSCPFAESATVARADPTRSWGSASSPTPVGHFCAAAIPTPSTHSTLPTARSSQWLTGPLRRSTARAADGRPGA